MSTSWCTLLNVVSLMYKMTLMTYRLFTLYATCALLTFSSVVVGEEVKSSTILTNTSSLSEHKPLSGYAGTRVYVLSDPEAWLKVPSETSMLPSWTNETCEPATNLFSIIGTSTISDAPATASLSNSTADAADVINRSLMVNPCVDGPGVIGGVVFNDLNNDGTEDGNEPGQQGVIVRVFDCDGVEVCNTSTTADGDWSCSGLTDGEEYRTEFSFPASLAHLQPGFAGTDNGTNTQFVTCHHLMVLRKRGGGSSG